MLKALTLLLFFSFSFSIFANEIIGDMQIVEEKVSFANLQPKMNRDTIRSCTLWHWEKICVDGLTQKTICKVVVNSIAIYVGDRGKALNYIAQNAGLLASDMLCEYYNKETCRDIHVCSLWKY